MRALIENESYLVSGATYGVCMMDDYYPNFVTVDTTMPIDPVLLAMDALNAAVWGCGGGAVLGGGIIGCGIGSLVGVGGTLMAVAMKDAYQMYLDAKKN